MTGIAFQFGGGASYQGVAFQSGPNLTQFGYAIVAAYSQYKLPLPTPRQVFLESSACFVQCSIFDIHGIPYAPSTIMWRMDDLVSGFNIVPWTQIAVPMAVNMVTCTSGNNNMITQTRSWESRIVTFQITDGFGDLTMQRGTYYLVKTFGGLLAGGDGFQGQTSFQQDNTFMTPSEP